MGIYVQNTFDYSASAELQQEFRDLQAPLNTQYGAYMEDVWTHSPEIPTPPGFPPTSGTYVTQRVWTDLVQAQNFVAEMVALLDANPSVKAFSVGPMTAGQN